MNIIIFDIMSLTRGRHCSGHRRWDIFTARCDASAVFTVFTMQCLSNVYLSVCLSKGVPFRRIPTGTPLTGASNATGYYKNDDFFSQISRCISETVMMRGVWQALNCLSIHATYCVIVVGASPGKTKM